MRLRGVILIMYNIFYNEMVYNSNFTVYIWIFVFCYTIEVWMSLFFTTYPLDSTDVMNNVIHFLITKAS